MSNCLIPLKSLPSGTHRFGFVLGSEFFADAAGSGIEGADLKADVTVENRPEAYLVGLHVAGTVEVACDRCLDPMTLPVDADYQLTVKYGPEHNEEDPDGLLVLGANEPDLDAAPLLRDTVILAIPARHSHEDPQDCNPGMRERLAAHSGRPATEATDPRWDALKGLTDKQ